MADSYKHTWKSSITAESEQLTNVDRVFVADGHIKLNPTIPPASVDFPVSLAFKKADVLSYRISAPADLVLKTNASGSPADTINLVANSPLEWNRDMDPAQMDFAGDVTAMFVTNAGTAGVDISIRILHDTTPSTPIP